MVPDYLLVPLGNYVTIADACFSDRAFSELALRAAHATEYLLDAWKWLSSHGPAQENCALAPRPPLFVAGAERKEKK